MTKITLEIPDELMSRLDITKESIQDIFLQALENYLEKEKPNITQTKTWELCGSLEIPHPEPRFIVEDEQARTSTNYAEHIDKILY
ncbi:MAG: hypothetical protein HEQ35_02610 [Gloeotrichia echinulata IR180]|jgi:hypothetical protein|nr:hypothetical protein [Gloeotrichia echinulata DEX184]